ncbi:MAG TPA: M23 family metallopeptidase [Daejeonella sp.]|nr:M23 family metallopeptidase [Daejeonella sp.]
MRTIYLIFLLLFSVQALKSQNIYPETQYPKTDFRPPLDLPPSLSGSFGELRSNHFHSGLDYRTNQREGYPVYAVADGYISRLRVQAAGFGNAIYITHPNGFTTVYAHLQRFNPQIAQSIKTYQYRIESFEVDFPLLPLEIPVKKGDIIAWSGNTGSSGGPHLHFEVRDSKTEEIINPQLFGLALPDRVKPTISGLYVYRLNGQPFSEKTPKQYFQVIGANGLYKLNQSPIINLSGEIGFGLITYDKNSASDNTLGVYSIELKVDGESIYSAVWERFAFQDSRAINSHLDYPALLTSGRRIQKSFIEPGNPIKLYKTRINQGLLNISDNQVHDVEYVVKDVAGNTSTLAFKMKYNPQSVLQAKETPGATRFYYNRSNEFETPELKLSIPSGNLYSDLDFIYSVSAKPHGAFSKMHHVHNRLTPVHSSYTLWIKADDDMPAELRSKALIVDQQRRSQGGTYENGFIKTNTNAFGNFYVTVDTIAPKITPVNISEGASMAGVSKMTFKISDNLSGIRSYTGTIDGHWVLMEFDAKTATLWHTFDEKTPPGKHNFQLLVTDMKSNTQTFKVSFYR